MNKFLLVLLVCCFEVLSAGTAYRYIVYFKDKSQQPDLSLFTKEALAKRAKYNIPFDERDYPINRTYIQELENNHAAIIYQSNWLNAVLVEADKANIELIKNLQFVIEVQTAEGGDVKKSRKDKFTGIQSGIKSLEEIHDCEDVEFEDNYTSSYAQFHLLNGEYLHEQGFNGENMIIAICDNGFYHANVNPGFSSIYAENRVLGTYDYVHGDSAVYDEYTGSSGNPQSHGSNCFSFIGGIKTNQYIGTASKAKFYLFHTENNASERLQEEFNLALALERCSQLGVDVVTTSLGYTTFDVPSENHDTSDLRKNNTPAAKAVNTAVSKGIIVLAAAGNEGTNSWKYISTPADADSAIAVAAVNSSGTVASFSSYGLPNDTRVKPNVAAMGVNATHLTVTGSLSSGSGTSYACPSLAGMVACLWQAFPSKTNWEIKTAVEESASQYSTPDNRIGYGIPDFKKAYQTLSVAAFVSNPQLENEYVVFPNPAKEFIYINNKGNSHIQSIALTNIVGQVVYSDNSPSNSSIPISTLSNGMYLIQITTDAGQILKKIIKD